MSVVVRADPGPTILVLLVSPVLSDSHPISRDCDRRYFVWGRDSVVANLLESSGVVGQVHVSEAAARLLHAQGFELAPRVQATLPPPCATSCCVGSAWAGEGGSGAASGCGERTYFLRGYRFECVTPEGGTDDVVVRVAAAAT